MKVKKTLVVLLSLVLFSSVVIAKKSTTFLKDGNALFDEITDMSSRNLRFEYLEGQKIHKNRIWMINFVNKNWNFPQERNQLNNKFDTIFLNNNDVIYKKIIDFSSRRRVFEFKKGGSVHVSQIKRIYFCCTKLPAKYKSAIIAKPNKPVKIENIQYSTLLLNGTSFNTPLKYMNVKMTGYTDKKQINSKLIYMLSFTNEKWNHQNDRKSIDVRLDTVFLKNGKVLFDTVNDYNMKRGTFTFTNIEPIHINSIKRIYFHRQKPSNIKVRKNLRSIVNRPDYK